MAWQWCLQLGLAVASLHMIGCKFKQRRAEPVTPVAVMPSPLAREMAAQPPLELPTPPHPPAAVQPPKADALTGIIPTLPQGGLPTGMTPAEIPEPSAPILPVKAEEEAIGGPVREKLEDLKKRIKERRDEKSTPPKLPSPLETPTTPAPTMPMLTLPEQPKAASDDTTSAKKLLDAALARYAEVNDFEAHLVKQESINGKPLPKEESIYRFRKQPLSVYNQVISDAGKGREMMYVRGQFGDKMHIITGKGDNPLVGAGFKTDLDPDSKTATSKSRWKVYEAGFTRNLNALSKAISTADVRHATVKYLGAQKRPEYPHELVGVEFAVRPGDELHLPKGGLRQIYFDPKPESPGYRLPVLVITRDDKGQEVEYYCFDRFKIPSGWTQADWNPSRLGKN